MKQSLPIRSLQKFFLGIVVIGLLLFLPAGSFRYWNAWLLMGVLFVPMIIIGLIMLVFDQELLRKRLNAKEEQREQKAVVVLSGALFIVSFVFAGLNWRFGWCLMPDWVVWLATGLFVASYLMYAEVLRENTYLSRTVEIQQNQKVIDTGLYGIVRHPMYTASTIMFLMMPLVLGSLISFLIMLLYLPLIVKRIRNEEILLEKELTGYIEYKQRVKYKMIPFVW
jgi:protein-S-isoprenylcysteine O-methyltransferase Ste14